MAIGPEGLGVFYSSQSTRTIKAYQYGWHMMKDTHNYENKPWNSPNRRRFYECGSMNT